MNFRGEGQGRRYQSVLPGLSDCLVRARSRATWREGQRGVLYSEPRGDVTPKLAAESPAKPSTATRTCDRTSSAAEAAKQKHEEKNPHHADYHPKNRVVHVPLPSLRWLPLGQGALREPSWAR